MVEDDDLLVDEAGTPRVNPPDPVITPPTVRTATNSGTYGGGGVYGSYGYNSGGIGTFTPVIGPLSPAPLPTNPTTPPTGNAYEFEYVESIGKIVDKAVSFISTAPQTLNEKAALKNRGNILSELGKRLNTLILPDGYKEAKDKALLDQMRPVMAGLFVNAYDPAHVKSGIWSTTLDGYGEGLARSLVDDSLVNKVSVREQVFRSTLMEVVTEVFWTKNITMTTTEQAALAATVKELAKTYAWLNPKEEATVPDDQADYGFLDRLWQLQVPHLVPKGGKLVSEFKSAAVIQADLQKAVEALGRLLEGVDEPIKALQFLNGLVQAASNVTSIKTDMKNAQFLRELVEFGVEVAKVNPGVTVGDQPGIEEWLEILWQGAGNKKLATKGVANFLDQPGDLQSRLERLDYSTKLVKAVQLIDDPEVKPTAHHAAHLSYVVNLGSSYAALKPSISSTDPNESPFLMLVAQGNLQEGANELERQISKALLGLQSKYSGRASVVIDENGKISVDSSGKKFSSGATSRIGWNLQNQDPNDDLYPISYRIQRQNGSIEEPIPGDTVFTYYSYRGNIVNRYGLYPGDALLYPTDDSNLLGLNILKDLRNTNYTVGEKVFDALRLAPYIAGPYAEQEVKKFIDLVSSNKLVQVVAVGTLGGIAAAQFVQPLGVILDVGLILLGGWQTGYSLGSFFYKAATAQSQTELFDAAREVTNVIANLLTTATPGGLLKLDQSLGLLNTTRILDAGWQVWKEVKNLQLLGRSLSITDVLPIVFRLFSGAETAVGKLLQYGTDGVTEFLKGGFSKFAGGAPTLEGLKDFADRFKRVSEFAELLFKPENAATADLLAQFPNAIKSVLDFNPKSAANSALIDSLVQAGIAVSPEKVVRVAEVPNGVVTKVKADGTLQTVNKIFLELGVHLGPGEGAGFVHILKEHASEFAVQGIAVDRLADVVMSTLTSGKRVGVQGSKGDRIIYEYIFNGQTKYMAITVGSNGFIVGANPLSSSFVP